MLMILASINTHVIKQENGRINVYIKDIDIDTMESAERFVYSLNDESEVLPLVEHLEENNRILLADFSKKF